MAADFATDFATTLDAAQSTASAAMQFCKAQRPDPQLSWFPIELVLREALNNAAVHGHASGVASLRITLSPSLVLICLNEPGPAYALHSPAPAPTDTALATHGRGLPIFRRFCHAISLQNNPNRLSLSLPFFVSASNKQPAKAMTDSPIQCERDSAALTLRPTCDVLAVHLPAMREAIKSAIDAPPPKVLFDLAHVEMLDSSGIGLLIATFNSLKPKGCEFAVINASADIADLLKSMCLDQHFPVSTSA